MKYFTDELWSKINSISKEERDVADHQWDKNMHEYEIVFEKIKSRLSERFLKIYMDNHGFHDFQIKNIVVNQKEYGIKNPVSLDIYLTDDEVSFKISYKCIKKLHIDYQERKDCIDRRGIDDWGYDEFTPVDEQILSHEILFASGATILIHFIDGSISVTKEKQS